MLGATEAVHGPSRHTIDVPSLVPSAESEWAAERNEGLRKLIHGPYRIQKRIVLRTMGRHAPDKTSLRTW